MIPQPEVQQVDRDAAADLIETYWSGNSEHSQKMQLLAASYRMGHSQGVWAQAFARHRAAAFEAGRAEGVREAAEVADREAEARHRMKDRAIALKTKFEARDHESMAIACVQVATAIRALSKEPTK